MDGVLPSALIALAVAALMFFVTWLAWTGRRREWAYRWFAAPRATPVTIVPAFGVLPRWYRELKRAKVPLCRLAPPFELPRRCGRATSS